MSTNTDTLRHHLPLRSNAEVPPDAEVREVTQDGRDYLVFPLIAAREMVLDYPEEGTREYLPGQRLEESEPMWSGTPLTFIHPDNRQRTAERPDAYTGNIIGEVHEPDYLDESKLRVLAYLDVEKALSIGGLAAEVVEKLRNGEELSVSAGYATLDDSYRGGTYNGEEYDVEQGMLIPDHVAVFPSDEFRARCSPEDGCAAPRANAVLDDAATTADSTETDTGSGIDDDMSEQQTTTNQDVNPESLSLQDHVAPFLASTWDVSTGEAQSFVATISGEDSDRDVLAALVAREYDTLDPVDVQTVLSRAEEGDITVNATTLGKMFKGALGKTATVDPAVLNHDPDADCECGAKANAAAEDAESETATEDDAAPSDDPPSAEGESIPSNVDEDAPPTTDEDADADSDGESGESDSEAADEASTEEDTDTDDSDSSETETEDTQNMPEVLSLEELAAKSAFGVATLEEWDESELNALEATILENNPELVPEAPPDEAEANAEDDEENRDNAVDEEADGGSTTEEDSVSDQKENTDDSEYVTKDDFNELKAMVEDAVNSKANAETERQAKVVANAIDGMSVDAAKALPEDELETLAEKHGGQRTNYGAVAGPVDRQPETEPEDVDEYPAGGRSDWEERRKSGGD